MKKKRRESLRLCCNNVSAKSFQDKIKYEGGILVTETLELFDLEENEFKAILNNLESIYSTKKSWYDTGLQLIFKNFGDLDELMFGVHVFSQGQGLSISIILSEYDRDTKCSTFNISSIYLSGLSAYSTFKKGETKIKEALQGLTFEELDAYTKQGVYEGSDEIFQCPHCNAQYRLRVLRVTEDGKVECQNCGVLSDPNEISTEERAVAHDS